MCRLSLIINRVCECVFTSGMWITEWEDEVKLRWSAFKEEAAQGRTAPPDVVKSQRLSSLLLSTSAFVYDTSLSLISRDDATL